MSRRAHRKTNTQAQKHTRKKEIPRFEKGMVHGLRQAMLPMLMGALGTKEMVLQLMQEAGIAAILELFAGEAEKVAGPKGKHQRGRRANHWGTTPAEFQIGGRKVSLPRPRVRPAGAGGRELELPALAEMQRADPLPERVMQQILLGVSTRRYEESLDVAPPKVTTRGASKSAASRHVVQRTRKAWAEMTSRSIEGLDIVVLLLDGIQVAEQNIVVALGVDTEGKKHALGLWPASTENSTQCIALLHNLLERGLQVESKLLCLVDGGKGLRKALRDVLGDAVLVQRCQQHKLRNVRSYLPKARHLYVGRTMREAYRSRTAKAARKKLQALGSWLERCGETGAAESLREGLEETLTVLKLGITGALGRFLVTTNAIENLMGSIRRVTRNVKRWQRDMAPRWTASAIVAAEGKFRRIKGHADLPLLVAALRPNEQESGETKVA